MAARTRNSGVLTLKHIACFAVIKRPRRWVPADEREVQAVVFGVAADAVLPGAAHRSETGVEATLFSHACRNVGMTFSAFEAGRPGRELVATGALGRTAEELV